MVVIDKEFESLIPPLSPEEFAQLEENCVKEGIRDALVVWPQEDGSDILIDGHNRWKIANKHQELFVNYKRMQFEDRNEAIEWIIRNQLGRRNIDEWTKFDLNKILEPIEKAKAKERQGARTDRNIPPTLAGSKGDSRDKMAERIGVSHGTYDKMKVIDEHGSDYIKEKVRSGDITINKAYLVTKGINDKSPAKLQKEFMDKVKQEHEAFTESKTVSLADVKTDQEHRRIIADDVYAKFLKAGSGINQFFISTTTDEVDFPEAVAEWSDDQKENAKYCIRTWMQALASLREVIN